MKRPLDTTRLTELAGEDWSIERDSDGEVREIGRIGCWADNGQSCRFSAPDGLIEKLIAALREDLRPLIAEYYRLRELCDDNGIDPDAHLRQHCTIDPKTLREVRGESAVYAVETVGFCRRCGVDLRLGVSMETAQRHGLLDDARMPMCSKIDPVLL